MKELLRLDYLENWVDWIMDYLKNEALKAHQAPERF